MEMTKARNRVLVPIGLLLAAGVLLIVLLMRQVVLAPAPTMHQITWTGTSAAAAPAVQASPNSAAASEQTITAIGSTAPLTAPKPATQPASESAPAPGSTKCPSQPGSGLPCSIP